LECVDTGEASLVPDQEIGAGQDIGVTQKIALNEVEVVPGYGEVQVPASDIGLRAGIVSNGYWARYLSGLTSRNKGLE
jgi:hypothetical protein